MEVRIIEAIRAEEAELLRKLSALRELLAVYGVKDSSEPPRPVAYGTSQSSGGREKVEITGFTDHTRKSVVLAMMAMLASPGLMKTRELVAFIERRGHEISGNNKVNALGALLARSADVISHGKSGWSLADKDRARVIVSDYGPRRDNSGDIDVIDILGDELPVLEDSSDGDGNDLI